MLSANVPYYILDLLQQVPAVYVQGLGRFEAIFHPAVIDLPEARIKPPYIEPDFRYDLESPSGILPKYIAYATGTQDGIARGAVAAFVKKVHEQTENGMTYLVEKFGTFSRSTSGHIRFTPDWDAFNLSFSGLEVLDLPANKESSGENQVFIPAPPVQKWEPDESKETATSPLTDAGKKEDTGEESGQIVAVETTSPHQDLIDQNTSRLWWIILTSAIVLIAILCAYLAWDIISNRNRLDELKRIYPDTVTISRVPRDTTQIPVDNIPLSESADTPLVTPPPASVPVEESGPPCYIVVGAFSEQANVTKMVDRLVSLGYTTEQMKSTTLTRVAIRTGCDKDNLQKMLNEVRSSVNPEAWIY